MFGALISLCQTAFVPSRHLLDEVLAANEILDLVTRAKKSCLLFKIDFEKAYDRVSWNFLRFIMKKMRFRDRWMQWKEVIVFTSFLSILVNGSPTADFVVERGLRKGDHFPPFLFVLVTEGLVGLIRKVVNICAFSGFQVLEQNSKEVLQFADNTLLLGEGDWKNVWSLKSILIGFELFSYLGINYHKRKLHGLNLSHHFVQTTSNFLACKIEGINFNFLGIPIGSNPKRIEMWKPLVDKIKLRLSTWKAKIISQGWRLTLINSVLSSLPTFLLYFFKAHVQVWKEIERIQRDFFGQFKRC